nr:hypothetical protein B0A51_04589 [Rachicladosporium sp. CCFEE 5018]
MAPKILLHGSGAIGTIYIYLLQKAGCSVTAVCRSNYEKVKKDGFAIDSDIYGKGIKISPKVVRSPEEAYASGPFDYVIVCTKAFPGVTPQIIAPAISEATTVVLIQNGIGIEDEYATAFPNNPLLSCVVYLPTTQVSTGHIVMGATEILQIGTYPAISASDSPAYQSAARLVKALTSAGSNTTLHPDIQEKRWQKLLINASWNPICALTLSRDVAYLASSPEAENVVTAVMAEVVSVARAKGYNNITVQMTKDQLARALERVGSKGIEPSMLVDVLKGRRMEVEVILGNCVREAKALGIDVPRLETLYVLGKALDEAMALRQPGKSLAGDETATSKDTA